MKILIVDDDPVSRDVLAAIIAKLPDHQVTVADGGETAWALLDDPSRWFDVLFLDQQMPGLDGLGLLQRIAGSPLLHSLEVVMCTAANDRTTITKAIQLGARHYIVKPPTEGLIAAKLEKIAAKLAERDR